LVTIFTREHGKIRAIAKGARRVPSRFGGRVEPFTYAEYYIAKGRSLDIVSQCQVVESFLALREKADTLYAGFYIIKLVNSGTAEGQHYPELFDLTLEFLLKLKAGEDGRQTAKGFEREFVKLEGIFHEGIDPHHSLGQHLERDLSSW